VFTLSGPGPLSLLRRQVNEVVKKLMSDTRERLIRPTYQDGMLKMNMSMTEKIKAGKLFTDMCEGLPEKTSWENINV
jgi:galactoside O-acetyltransferase